MVYFALNGLNSKTNNVKYRHLFFDLDHTLWDFDANAKDALTDMFNFYSSDLTEVHSFELFYTNYLQHNALLWTRYENGFISHEELKWRRMWRTLLDFKIANEALAKKMSACFLETLPTKNKVFDYTYEILGYLTEKNYSLHLITNGFEKVQYSKLNNSNLTQYFGHVITSEISNSVKPKKEIFEYALNKCGGINCESLMIGDNLNADILGAQNAGMDSVFVNHINAECTGNPTYIIRHLKELESIL
jgi:putative hydrolase of the HAD superfamily